MSYQYYLQQMQYFMALGAYNFPVNCTTIPFFPLPQPVQNLPHNVPGNEPITVESSDEEDDIDERSFFCSNLADNVTEELLYEVFFQAGPLRNVYIPKDNNGKRRSYGFVTYKYRCSLPYALKLYQGLVLYGRRLNIKFQGKSDLNNPKR